MDHTIATHLSNLYERYTYLLSVDHPRPNTRFEIAALEWALATLGEQYPDELAEGIRLRDVRRGAAQ